MCPQSWGHSSLSIRCERIGLLDSSYQRHLSIEQNKTTISSYSTSFDHLLGSQGTLILVHDNAYVDVDLRVA
jgi:hypothetical protein